MAYYIGSMYVYNTDTSTEIKERLRQLNNTLTTEIQELETRLVENNITMLQNNNSYATLITALETQLVTNNNTYSTYIQKLEDSLIEVNNNFTTQISRLCQATCSWRAQDTRYAGIMPINQNDHPSQTTRCVECCKQLTQNACESLALDDNFPPPDCRWLLDSGGCISNPGVIGFLG